MDTLGLMVLSRAVVLKVWVVTHWWIVSRFWSDQTESELALAMDIGYGYRLLCLFNVVIARAVLHCMHDQLVVYEDDKMSSFRPMLKVMKTQIEGKQLAPKRTSDASTTKDNAAPSRGWLYGVIFTSACFASSNALITSCSLSLFFSFRTQISIFPAVPVTWQFTQNYNPRETSSMKRRNVCAAFRKPPEFVGLGRGIYHALVTLLGRRESPQCRHVIRCSFSTMCSMCSGNAQLLMDGRMIPNSSRMSNYLRHSSSQFGSSHRGLEKRNVVAQTIVTGYAARRLAN
ncbi:hypothetical protein T10_7423 [Trichinella papuae]|uniref:Uncharacterized protein n=1 Tax=Trichinella papuae TaxID=268474 RepID=A0A0V1MAT1_9BILA|nr:hypothetical protein T10_7423 [Trichinella papuae]